MADLAGRLTSRVAIVTGGARGIGAAVCRQLARAGARVIVADSDFGEARQTAETLTAQHGEVTAEPLDVTDDMSIQSLVPR